MLPERDGYGSLIHDLRNHVAVVEGFAHLLERGGDRLTDQQRADYTQRIVEAAAQIKQALDAADAAARRSRSS
jgi:light-regulated signal transduction histidine kinase (bacteriophytochrome)